MAKLDDALRQLDEWYSHLPPFKDKLPSRGTIGAAVYMLHRLKTNYSLDMRDHITSGKGQITGISKASIQGLFKQFGEMRELTAIGGRTNRGGIGDMHSFLGALRPLNLDRETEAERIEILTALQREIVTVYIARFFAAKRIKAAFDPSSATTRFIRSLLENARQNNKAGPVAEYLVGAKLACRFPDKEIRNKRSFSADVQSGFAGDFEVGNTVFHVTVAPMPELYDKLKMNLDRGQRAYLLVPAAQVVGTQQNEAQRSGGRIAVESIESFIATNIDELSEFDGSKLITGLRRLLEKYNERVREVETDLSMLIDIPPNLQ